MSHSAEPDATVFGALPGSGLRPPGAAALAAARRLYERDGPVVADVSYDTLDCSISQGSASVLSDLVIGRSVSEV
jgi:hypothetical protein